MKETYKTYESSLPSYISTLSNPMRRRHNDQLLVTESTVKPRAANFVTFISIKDEFYNAWEEDIAVVNIFFGKGTVMGEKDLFGKIYLKSCQSLREASEWVLWTLLPPLEGSLASVLDSASSHSSRSSTGFLLASSRLTSTRRVCKRVWIVFFLIFLKILKQLGARCFCEEDF